MYISTVIDGYDFRPIGWAISRNNDAELIMNSLKSIKINIDGAIIHSDHGAVYSSHDYYEYCKKHNLKISMSGIGKSLENYPIEHHWTFLKTMCLWHIPYENRTLANVRKELNNFYSWFANFFKFNTNNENSINYLYNQINKSCPTFYA